MSLADGNNEISEISEGIENVLRLTRAGDLITPTILLLLTLMTFFLLHDQVFPDQVTGQDTDGNTVTLTVCPAPTKFEELYKDRVDTSIEPALDKCVTYISARGLDRLAVLPEWVIIQFTASNGPEFCGMAGLVEKCYKLCTVSGKSIMRKFGSLSCLVYDNGRPDKTEISLKEIITERLLLPNTDAAVTSEFMCMGSNVDYTNGNSKGTFVYCVEPCASQAVPVQSNPSPNFCYEVYGSSFFERIISYVSFLPNYIEEEVSGFKEYSFCSPDNIGSDGACPSAFLASARTFKGCRPDGKGVWSLPPGETTCLVFLNGHDWPVGATFLIAATSLIGTSLVGGAVTFGGISSVTSACPDPRFCSVAGKCCRLVFTPNGGVQCPDIC